MSTEDLAIEVQRRVYREVDYVRNQVFQEERGFYVLTGSKLTIKSLLDAGALHPDIESSVSQWVSDGGFTELRVADKRIYPPELPSG